METNSLAESVLFLGGSPCSGKSSIAASLCQRYGLRYYQCDEYFSAHAAAATVEVQPNLQRISLLRDDALWLRPVAELLADEIAVYREEFAMIESDVRDLLAVAGQGPRVLVEGAALLPDEVFARCGSAVRAAWLVPSPEFQWLHYSRRDWAKELVSACSDPDAAFAHWMQRDIEFANWIEEQARSLGYACLRVDGSTSLAENGRWVELQLSLASVKGGSA